MKLFFLLTLYIKDMCNYQFLKKMFKLLSIFFQNIFNYRRGVKESEKDSRDDLYRNESGGAGRFAFSIWRMLPPPTRSQASCEPHEKPLLLARYRLIYSRKVAIVDIKPATPTLYRKRVACVTLIVSGVG